MKEISSSQRILARLADARSGALRILAVRSVIIFLCSVALLATAGRATSLILELDAEPYPIIVASCLAAFAIAWFYGARQWAEMKTTAWLSNLWRSSSDPEVAELLLSAQELAESIDLPEVREKTRQLMRIQLDAVWERLSRIPISECLPRIWTVRLRRSSIATALLCISVSFTVDNFFASAVKTASEASVPISWVKGLRIEVEPPDYSQKDKKQYENTNGTISAFAGSTIAGSARAISPDTETLILILPNGEQLPLETVGDKVSFSFTAQQSGKWAFAAQIKGASEPTKETGQRTLTVIPDKPPIVERIKPQKDRTVSPSDLLQIIYQARDDFGLTKSELVVALDGDLEQAERSKLDTLRGKKVKNAAELDLSLFDVQAGDRIAVYIECTDVKQPKGQIGRSKALYLTVESAEDDHKRLAADLKKLLEPFLLDLADRLEIDQQKITLRDISGIHQRTIDNTTAADSVITRLSSDPLTPAEVSALLKTKLETILAALNTETKALNRTRLEAQKIAAVNRSMPPLIESIEHFIIAIEAATARLALEDMQALTRQIQQRKERIRDLLNAYRENPNQNLKNRILRNVKRLKQKMQALQERMAQLRQKLPEEFLNLDGLKSSKLSENMKESAKTLDDLESLLEAGKIDEAMKALDELSESLDAFDQQVSEDMETLHRENDPKRQQAISEMMDRTKDLIKAQASLMRETKEAKDRGERAFQNELETEAKDELNQIAIDLVEAERDISSQRDKSRSSYRKSKLDKLAEETAKALESLEKRRFHRSEQQIGKSVEISRQLTWDRTSSDHEQDIEINRKLRSAEQRLKTLLQNARQARESAQNQQVVESQARRQADLKDALDKLQSEMKEKGKSIPGLDGKPTEAMQEAGSAMGKARESLQKGSPGQAQPSQSEAMNALKQTLQNLRQAGKPQPAERDGRGRSKTEKVEIPDGEDYAAPEAFREELLRAMKRKTAKPNEDAVKRYYRSLVE